MRESKTKKIPSKDRTQQPLGMIWTNIFWTNQTWGQKACSEFLIRKVSHQKIGHAHSHKKGMKNLSSIALLGAIGWVLKTVTFQVGLNQKDRCNANGIGRDNQESLSDRRYLSSVRPFVETLWNSVRARDLLSYYGGKLSDFQNRPFLTFLTSMNFCESTRISI